MNGSRRAARQTVVCPSLQHIAARLFIWKEKPKKVLSLYNSKHSPSRFLAETGHNLAMHESKNQQELLKRFAVYNTKRKCLQCERSWLRLAQNLNKAQITRLAFTEMKESFVKNAKALLLSDVKPLDKQIFLFRFNCKCHTEPILTLRKRKRFLQKFWESMIGVSESVQFFFFWTLKC